MLMRLSSWRTSTLALARTILPVASAKRRAGDLNIPLCGDIFGIPRNERRELDMRTEMLLDAKVSPSRPQGECSGSEQQA
ncbi:hypothetical protein NKJ09_30965 [Mesorhizobium sp. M0189]|uniref:hypothetical protein n=1 Tax=unclassified Mesorhizobium TaxID=325217 RepID=UPI003335B219